MRWSVFISSTHQNLMPTLLNSIDPTLPTIVMMLNILLLCIPFLANAATLEADELGNIVAAVSEGNKVSNTK